MDVNPEPPLRGGEAARGTTMELHRYVHPSSLMSFLPTGIIVSWCQGILKVHPRCFEGGIMLASTSPQTPRCFYLGAEARRPNPIAPFRRNPSLKWVPAIRMRSSSVPLRSCLTDTFPGLGRAAVGSGPRRWEQLSSTELAWAMDRSRSRPRASRFNLR